MAPTSYTRGVRACSVCGRESRPEDRFCAHCGSRLPAAEHGEQDAAAVAPPSPAEPPPLAEPPPPPAGAPFVGREFELDQLDRALERTRESRSPQLATICGPAGIGKTRLAHEFAARASGDALCLAGTCADYGDDDPLAPMRQALAGAGLDSAAAAAALFEGDPDCVRAAAVLDGLFTGKGADADALRWVLRRTLELLAAERPLVLVLDEIHHADPLLLDLLEHLPATPRPAPVVVVCLARPELLDRRPHWGHTERHAFSLRLGGLEPAQMEQLLDGLGTLPPPTKQRLVDTAGGNPLFLEHLFELGRTTGSLSSAPCVDALLAARLELLPDRERKTLECAAVLGTTFAPADIAALTGDADGNVLDSLVRRALLCDDGGRYRFRHVLVREVAYNQADAERRIDLHERLAAGEAPIHGRAFHLERATRLRHEHGLVDAEALERAFEAATELRDRAAGALGRAELATAVVLLERATGLFDDADPRRIRLLPDLGHALLEIGETQGGLALLEEATARAEELGERGPQGHARLSLLWAQRFAALPTGWARAAGDAVSALASEFEAAGDDRGVARAWTMLASLLMLQGHAEEAGALAERALEFARRAGDVRAGADALRVSADVLVWGPTPAEEAARTLEQAIGDGAPLALEISLRARLAALRAATGDAAAAREGLDAADSLATEAGVDTTPCCYWRGIAELWLGDAAAAEQSLGAAQAAVGDMTRIAWATVPALHGEALCRLGRYDEASRSAAASREAAAEHDLQAQLLWRTVEARALARRGDHERAAALARAALAFAEGSDAIALLADAELALTEVRLLATDVEESAAAAKRAAAYYGAKGMGPWETKARRLLEELTAEPLTQGA